jgi:hypothetical protein
MAFLAGVHSSYRCHHELCPNTEGARSIADALQVNSTLQKLGMRDNAGVGDAGAVAIAQAIGRHTVAAKGVGGGEGVGEGTSKVRGAGVASLDLAKCGLSAASLPPLLQAAGLDELILFGNELGAGIAAVLLDPTLTRAAAALTGLDLAACSTVLVSSLSLSLSPPTPHPHPHHLLPFLPSARHALTTHHSPVLQHTPIHPVSSHQS